MCAHMQKCMVYQMAWAAILAEASSPAMFHLWVKMAVRFRFALQDAFKVLAQLWTNHGVGVPREEEERGRLDAFHQF